MATLKQGHMRKKNYKKHYDKFNLSRVPALQKRPQVKGIVSKISNMSPKKPNSAVRIVAKVKLTNGLRIIGRMSGIGYLCGKYNRVLVNGGELMIYQELGIL